MIKTTNFRESNISVEYNTSSLTIDIYFSAQNQTTWFQTATLYCSCNGQTQSTSVSHPRGGSASASFTFNNILHDTDGTKTVSWSWSCATGTQVLGTVTDSGSRRLTDIPRNAVIVSAPNFNDEENPTITYNNPAGDIVSLLQACISLTGEAADIPYRDIPKTGTSYTFVLTEEDRNILRQATPNNNELNVIFHIKTIINNVTFYNTATRKMTIVNANPTFSNFDYFDINPTTIALTGSTHTNVNGYSNIRAFVPEINKATAKKYATMSKYRFTCGTNQPSEVAYSDSADVYMDIEGATSGTYNVYAIDSRNNATQVVKLATTEIAYTPINFNTSSCSVVRNNGGVGRYAVLTLSGNIWNDNFGSVSNSIKSISYEYKKTSEDDTHWATGPTIITPTLSGNTFSFEDEIASNETGGYFDLEASYDFRITISDELSTKQIQLTPMARAVPNISFADEGVGIMCDYDESLGGALQVAGQDITKREVATAYLSSEVTNIQETWIPLNSIDSNSNNLTLSNNGIRIGAGISKILVSGNVFYLSNTNNSYLWTSIRNQTANKELSIAIDNYNTYFASTSHSPKLVEVSEGDIIKLFKIDNSTGTIRAGANTYLTVEVIEYV